MELLHVHVVRVAVERAGRIRAEDGLEVAVVVEQRKVHLALPQREAVQLGQLHLAP